MLIRKNVTEASAYACVGFSKRSSALKTNIQCYDWGAPARPETYFTYPVKALPECHTDQLRTTRSTVTIEHGTRASFLTLLDGWKVRLLPAQGTLDLRDSAAAAAGAAAAVAAL